jgi:hypothetical protein
LLPLLTALSLLLYCDDPALRQRILAAARAYSDGAVTGRGFSPGAHACP